MKDYHNEWNDGIVVAGEKTTILAIPVNASIEALYCCKTQSANLTLTLFGLHHYQVVYVALSAFKKHHIFQTERKPKVVLGQSQFEPKNRFQTKTLKGSEEGLEDTFRSLYSVLKMW